MLQVFIWIERAAAFLLIFTILPVGIITAQVAPAPCFAAIASNVLSWEETSTWSNGQIPNFCDDIKIASRESDAIIIQSGTIARCNSLEVLEISG